MTAARETYTPALGHAALTPVYDAAIALMTRERFVPDNVALLLPLLDAR